MNKLYRLTLSFILIFGWLFLTPAYSDDPLSLAEQEIQDLNDSIADLNYKDEFVSLIGLAEQKYDDAVYAKQAMDNASNSYNNALQSEATALSEKEAAQLAVDEQTMVVTSKLTNKNTKQEEYNSAQIALNAHIATYGNGGNQGVYFRIYPLSRMGNYAYLAEGAGLMCHGSISTFDTWAGSGAICGLSQNIIGIFEATVTVPEGINAVKFAGYTDDGFRLYVDGVLTTADQWQEQGVAWSPYTQWFDTSSDKTLNLQAWWYNGGGPGSIHVGVGTYEWWSGIPSNWLSYGQGLTQEQIDQRAALQTDRNTKYAQYQTALSEYNTENNTLSTYNQTLTTKITTHNTAVTNTTNALTAKNNAISTYDQSIIDLNSSIDDAWEYYEEQMAREIAIALAQAAAAAANQPTPEPSPEPTPGPSPEPSPEPEPTEEATPEPTPEPSPEQTEPSDPTPTPEPETTDEPKPEPTVDPEPTPEPSPEPSPQPSDIDPEPTPEPEPTPSEPSEESPDNTIIEDEELAALVPEKGEGTTEDLSGVIANLTSKDNKLITLTSEQVAAVSQTLKALTTEAKVEVAQDLGIKASEVEKIAEVMKENPALATAFVEFNNRAESAGDSTMPYTLADATTEVQTEAFLADPVGALTNIDIEKVLDPSEWGKDMTDDQREKAQEVVIPVVLVANVVSSVMSLRRV